MRKVCLVTSEIVGPFKNGGIGTHNFYLMQYLAELGDVECTVVYNGAIEEKTYEHWAEQYRAEYGAELIWIHPSSPEYNSQSTSCCYWEQISDANYRYLVGRDFDMIIFQEMLGGGFRTIQAKKNLGMFSSSELVVMVHSSWQWINESMRLLPEYGLVEMLTKYLERYSVENCDILISPSQYMIDWSATDHSSLPEKQWVLPYLFDASLEPAEPRNPVTEIIFFGRLEQRKGLLLFLDSLLSIMEDSSEIPSTQPIPVYLLGRFGQTEDGGAELTIAKYSKKLMKAFSISVIDNLGHHEALQFLRTHKNALVACPSLQDNSPFAIIENILLGTNIISCNTGGIPELFADRSRLAEPNVESLSQLMIKGISGKLPKLKPAYSVSKARQAWHGFLNNSRSKLEVIAQEASEVSASSSTVPINLLQFYTEGDSYVLRDLRDREEPILIPEGTLNADRLRDSLLNVLNADFIIALAPGYRLTEQAHELLQISLSRRPFCGFTAYSGRQNQDTSAMDAPLGPCLEATLAINCVGKAIAIIPLHQLLQSQSTTFELLIKSVSDGAYFWSFLAHHILSGHEIDVIPEVLCLSSLAEDPLPTASSIYNQRSQIIASMSGVLPKWASRLLPYVTDLSPRAGRELTSQTAQTQRSRAASLYSKIARSLKRLKP